MIAPKSQNLWPTHCELHHQSLRCLNHLAPRRSTPALLSKRPTMLLIQTMGHVKEVGDPFQICSNHSCEWIHSRHNHTDNPYSGHELKTWRHPNLLGADFFQWRLCLKGVHQVQLIRRLPSQVSTQIAAVQIKIRETWGHRGAPSDAFDMFIHCLRLLEIRMKIYMLKRYQVSPEKNPRNDIKFHMKRTPEESSNRAWLELSWIRHVLLVVLCKDSAKPVAPLLLLYPQERGGHNFASQKLKLLADTPKSEMATPTGVVLGWNPSCVCDQMPWERPRSTLMTWTTIKNVKNIVSSTGTVFASVFLFMSPEAPKNNSLTQPFIAQGSVPLRRSWYRPTWFEKRLKVSTSKKYHQCATGTT